MVNAMGIDSYHVEGNDSIQAFRVAKDVISKIRKSGRPQFIEFSTYRWLEHCGPNYDNDIGYREVKEFEMWKNDDPISNLEAHLKANKLVTNNYINNIRKAIFNEIDEAFSFAENSNYPAKDTLYDFIYK